MSDLIPTKVSTLSSPAATNTSPSSNQQQSKSNTNLRIPIFENSANLQNSNMQLTALFTTLMATAAHAAPASDLSSRQVSVENPGDWAVTYFKRKCNTANTKCTISCGIIANDGSPEAKCRYLITGNPASQASYGNVLCGPYAVSSGWSGQFGEGNGYTTLSMSKDGQIIYPSYTDAELAGGKVVASKSYTPTPVS